MGKSKTSFDYFAPRHYNFHFHRFILDEKEEQYKKRCIEVQKKLEKERKRAERLKQMIKAFSEVFDVEFPEISMQVKKILFEEWRTFNYNKEVVQADIQIKNLLAELNNARALNRWIEVYKEFRKNET